MTMSALAYSALNDRQLAQVAYLFADAFFITDPAAYQYEISRNGDVTGRSIAVRGCQVRKARSIAPVKLTAQEETHLTDQIIQRARMNMSALCASIAQGIYQQSKQLEEVNHE
jgi:hypothetical protein